MQLYRKKIHALFCNVFLYVFVAIFFNEYLIYYVTLWSCSWPTLNSSEDNTHLKQPFKFLVLSDPHLLGEREGHWFDKLRREWQMYRSYQTALGLFHPTAVFVLGDVFDEGKWATKEQWKRYVDRAKEVFATPTDIMFFAVVGNHDVGFHHHITRNRLTRFFEIYNTENVQVLTLRGNLFVIINSMGLDDDGCFMCADVQNKLEKLSKALLCSNGEETLDCADVPKYTTSKPVVLQHFPLYRVSDVTCNEADSAPKSELKQFVPKHDVISKDASKQILQLLKPRLILSGHTHDACSYHHEDGTLEVSVASFSWRNRKNPSFLLVTMTPEVFAISKCFLPNENTVMLSYAIIAFLLLYKIYSILRRKR